MKTIVTAFAAAGILLGATTATMSGGKEEKIQLSAAPAAVRATIEREAGGATVEEVEREVEDGKTVYEAEFVKDGKKWEIEVAEDGTLLEKEEDDD